MHCPGCQNNQIVKNGKMTLHDHRLIQKYWCQACDKQFSERMGTPLVRLQTSSMVVSLALNVRTKGMGVRVTGHSFGNRLLLLLLHNFKGGDVSVPA